MTAWNGGAWRCYHARGQERLGWVKVFAEDKRLRFEELLTEQMERQARVAAFNEAEAARHA